MSQRRPLDVIQVNKPCPADWKQMEGDGNRRFCTHCQKFVHNLSAMPANQAEKLICENAGSLCVRFARDASGKVLTIDYAAAPPNLRRRGVMVLVSLLSSLGFAGTWAACKLLRKPDPPAIQMFVGDIAPLPTPPPPSSAE
jgi:hypothetical protein